jgi:hypothetical protein
MYLNKYAETSGLYSGGAFDYLNMRKARRKKSRKRRNGRRRKCRRRGRSRKKEATR